MFVLFNEEITLSIVQRKIVATVDAPAKVKHAGRYWVLSDAERKFK